MVERNIKIIEENIVVESDIMYAVIRIRGTVNVTPKIKKALIMMNLRRANNLSLWGEDAHALGMINKVKDYVAYGKISDEMLKELIAKRARSIVPGSKMDAKKIFEALKEEGSTKKAGIRNLFTMSPPRGGFERKGIKVPYKLGGALGNMGEKINALIKRMM